MVSLEEMMKIAIEQARTSLLEGNHGFGAILLRDGKILAQAHDRDESEHDPTSHAEMNVIRSAASKIGKDLAGCLLISTHEPCPMCASAIVWSNISEVGYGYSIEDSLTQGRDRINLSCKEVFQRANRDILIHQGILKDECELLYKKSVRNEIKRLRNITDRKLDEYNEDSVTRRITWYEENRNNFSFIDSDILGSAYRLLLCRFGIKEEEMPIKSKSNKEIVFHSQNFCPTLEACKILNLDTRSICKKYNEGSTNVLIKQIDRRLVFERNYEKIRPYSDYCEEIIRIND